MADTLKGLLSLIQRTRSALPDIQERAIQNGDTAELERAQHAMERLNSLAERHLAKNNGGGGGGGAGDPPSYAESREMVPEQEVAPSLSSGSVIPSVDYEPPSRLRPPKVVVPPPPTFADWAKANPTGESRLVNLPKAITRARDELKNYKSFLSAYQRHEQQFDPTVVGFVKGVAPNLHDPDVIGSVDIKELRAAVDNMKGMLAGTKPRPMNVGYGADPDPEMVRNLDRLVSNIERDEKDYSALKAQAPSRTPVVPPIPEEQRKQVELSNLINVGAATPAEERQQVVGPVLPAIEAAAAPPAETPKSVETAISTATTEKTNEANALTEKAREKFGSDDAVLNSFKPFVADAPKQEQDFFKQAEAYLGKRPGRSSLENAILAILYGAATIGARWASRYWGGSSVIPDFDAEGKAYDARKYQLARDLAGQDAANRRSAQARGFSLQDKLILQGAQAATAERVANIRANASLLSKQMDLASEQQKRATLPLTERKKSITNEYNTLAKFYENAVYSGMKKPDEAQAEFEEKAAPLLQRIADIDAEIARVLSGK